ncbi:hypothetical protein M422DRAFT_66742 [Sphaerobolus stellatus SS14]|nr:hypothetical protein M422DRAFT_66742 [Sphaerobolus stellatus SS14]
MAGQKRERDEPDVIQKPKKIKFDNGEPVKQAAAPKPAADEIDFPRGGGTELTALEYKSVRAEAMKEADAEVVFENSEASKKKKTKRKETDAGGKGSTKTKKGEEKKSKNEHTRIEHLNYKRITEGMKILCQIIAIQPLALIVSLPSQLFGHIPITHISTQLTKQLESMDEENDADMDVDDEELASRRPPELFEIFRVGQYVHAVVTNVNPSGVSARDVVGLRRKLDEAERACQRVELSVVPEKVNVGVSKADLTAGFVLPAAVQSVEDHGYILDLGISDITGFLSFKEAEKAYPKRLPVGHVLDVCTTKMAENGRTCNVSVEPKTLSTASISQITSITSILPGTLVQGLITNVSPGGLNVQMLGYFEGTIDASHLPSGDGAPRFKLGQKIKARVLWDMIVSEPRKFALSLLPHILELEVPHIKGQTLSDAFPIGTILDAIKVIQVEPERGLALEVQEGLLGYVHIRHVSDDHVPSLSPASGHWKIGTIHRARVIGFYALDGVLQLSLQPSVLEQKFLQVQDVEAGETLKATVKRLTSSALFVSISGNVDGVIWPNHWADIMLKRPQQRFKEGSTVKCRVLVVDPERKRIALTAKRTLVESELPIITKLDDAKVGLVTHAVVYKVLDKAVLVEFFNNLRAHVYVKEASEVPLTNLAEAFPIGKPVKVRIIHVDRETGRITASIRSATSKAAEIVDVHAVQVGESVKGPIKAVHKDHVVITLQPSGVTGLLSLKNLANSRGTTAAQLIPSLKVGEELDELIVLSQNPNKGIVIISTLPKSKPKTDALPGNEGVTPKSIQADQVVSAQVTGYGRGGTTLFISSGVKGTLHPTDACDDYDVGTPFPVQGTVLKGIVLNFDKGRRNAVISTRQSRLQPSETTSKPRDLEVSSASDLAVGQTVRGFIKSITDHGLFVTLGRNVDARVQIKALFDEYVKDWKTKFELNQLVEGKISRVNPDTNQVEMTFRKTQAKMALDDFEEGQKVDCFVRKKEPYGVFIQIKDTKVSGLCHKSEISDNEKADIAQVLTGFKEGDPVRAIILKIDAKKKKISFGLKPSYFIGDDVEMKGAESDDEDDDVAEEEATDDDATGDEEAQEVDEEDGESSADEEHIDVLETADGMGELELPTPAEKPSAETGSVLKVRGGFKWPGQKNDDDEEEAASNDSTDEQGDEEEDLSKPSKKKKKGIEYDLTADMHTRQPESTSDFERLLLGSPNSSFLWIQYMSFQLQLSEIEKAKEIGKRALKTINFREEGEKLNVWIALLNLENKYGTDESLEAVFRDAARHNDSKTVHLRMAAIFDETDRHEKAVEQYQRTCKKFGKSSKAWTLFAEYYYKREEVEAARLLLTRSLQSLEKRKHLKIITKFAQLEYRLGDPERGRTIFEGIVDSHPKRFDLWSIYIDMEAAQKNIQSMRNIFDRVLSLKMTSHKAKAFFKKWLELEKRVGDEEGENAVKAKAIEWTRKAGAGAA